MKIGVVLLKRAAPLPNRVLGVVPAHIFSCAPRKVGEGDRRDRPLQSSTHDAAFIGEVDPRERVAVGWPLEHGHRN